MFSEHITSGQRCSCVRKEIYFTQGVEGLRSLFCNVGSTLASAIYENKISRISVKNEILAYIQKSTCTFTLKESQKEHKRVQLSGDTKISIKIFIPQNYSQNIEIQNV